MPLGFDGDRKDDVEEERAIAGTGAECRVDARYASLANGALVFGVVSCS